MDFGLSEEQELLQRSAREFLAREREAVDEHVAASRRDGVLRPFVPAETIERPSTG